MTASPAPRWATREEAAEHARVSVYTIDRGRAAGLIPVHGVGGKMARYNLNDIDALLLGERDTQASGEDTRSAAH